MAQPAAAANVSGKPEAIAVENGVVSFFVATNVPAIEVRGKSSAVEARIELFRDANGVSVERVEAWMPVKTLSTGMALRDHHMRRQIFTTSSGDTPDVRFEGGKIPCPGVTPAQEATCLVSGTLTIRDVSRGFSIPLRIRRDDAGSGVRIAGDALVKLSDYAIEQPSQLGVKTANDVQIHLQLSGKKRIPISAATGSPR